MGRHSPVAELLGVLQSLSVASQSCPVHLAACLMAWCLCRGRRAREMGHLWAVSSARLLSGQPWQCRAPGHPPAPVLQAGVAVVPGWQPRPGWPQHLLCQQQGEDADPAERQPR